MSSKAPKAPIADGNGSPRPVASGSAEMIVARDELYLAVKEELAKLSKRVHPALLNDFDNAMSRFYAPVNGETAASLFPAGTGNHGAVKSPKPSAAEEKDVTTADDSNFQYRDGFVLPCMPMPAHLNAVGPAVNPHIAEALSQWACAPIVVVIEDAHFYIHPHIVALMFPKKTFDYGSTMAITKCTPHAFAAALAFMYRGNIKELSLDLIDNEDITNILFEFAAEHSNSLLMAGLIQATDMDIMSEKCLQYIARIYKSGVYNARFREVVKDALRDALYEELGHGYNVGVPSVLLRVQTHLADCGFHACRDITQALHTMWREAMSADIW